ncbi:MAG: hypothetical protein AB7T22_11025 [Calditrichaceae bacterium]
MEFLLVPIIFAVALLLLSLGKLMGGKEVHTSCSAGSHIEGVDACGSCDTESVKFYTSEKDPGFENVAKLGNPNRKTRFIDKLDFKPERFN